LTGDIDLLVDTASENERRVFEALRILPDKAVNHLDPGDVERFTVVRVADEIVVDLMKSGCGVDYAEAIRDVVYREVDGVRIPFASPKPIARRTSRIGCFCASCSRRKASGWSRWRRKQRNLRGCDSG